MIGLIIPFLEHEWYKNLTVMLKVIRRPIWHRPAVIDADQNVRDEMELRRQEIAKKSGLLDRTGRRGAGGWRTDCGLPGDRVEKEKRDHRYHQLGDRLRYFEPHPGITLVSTGGVVRDSTQMLVGPTAEGALKELRADKLFLMVSGITLDFGLSHNAISEVTIKQAMIRSSREVILLADHTAFGAEAGIQVAPLSAVRRLITDDALPPSTRLEFRKRASRYYWCRFTFLYVKSYVFQI